MARVEDYIGKSFGALRIEAVVGHGAEAEVFACTHIPTRIVYILRLPAHDAELWGSNPLIPPRNASIERPNANGSWHAAQLYYSGSLQARQDDKDAWVFKVPAIYGVLDQKYLVPVASPIWRKGAVRVDQVLRAMPAEAVDGLGPLEVLLLLMATSACIASRSELASNEWLKKWSNLAGGSIAIEASRRYLRSGTHAPGERERAIRLVASVARGNPGLAENLVLRLCSCIARGIFSVEEAWATLRCTHFRRNVTYDELQQIVSAHALVAAEAFPEKDTLAALRFVLAALSEDPDDEIDDPSAFETLSDQGNLGRFDLFLQEFAGRKQSVPMVTLSGQRTTAPV
jgi:hypothetical protein